VAIKPKGKERRVRFDRFALGLENGKSVDGTLVATHSKNCDLSEGTLRCGVGRSPFTDAYGAEKSIEGATALTVFSYRSGLHNYKYRFGYTNGAGGLFLYNQSSGAFEDVLGAGSEVQLFEAMNGSKEVVLFAYGDGGAWSYVRSGTLTKVFSRKTVAGCFYGERAFLVNYPFTLNYSVALAPENFESGVEEGGKIELPVRRGILHSFAELDGCLYGFCDEDVVRLRAQGSALDFQAERVDVAVGEIYKGSVRACGRYVFFLTADGLWAFDGKNAKRVLEELKILPAQEERKCFSASVGGKYYLEYVDRAGETRSIVVNQDGKSGYFSYSKSVLSDCAGRGLFLENGYAYRVDDKGSLPEGEVYSFDSECDFGCLEEKTLKTLTVNGRGKAKIKIASERAEKSLDVELADGEKEFDVQLKGKRFSLRIRLQEGCEISSLGACVYCLTGN